MPSPTRTASLTGVTFARRSLPRSTSGAVAVLCRPARPTFITRATMFCSRSARRTPFRGSSATSVSSSTSGTCPRSATSASPRPIPRSSSAATRHSVRRTSSGPSPTVTRRRSRSTRLLPATTSPSGRRRASLWSARRWASTSGATTTTVSNDIRFKVPQQGQGGDRAAQHQGSRSNSGSTCSSLCKEAERCLNCDVQTVFADTAVHRVRRLRRYLSDGLHHLHRETAKMDRIAHERLIAAGAQPDAGRSMSKAN